MTNLPLLIYLGLMLFDWFLVLAGYLLAKKGVISVRVSSLGFIALSSFIPILDAVIILVCLITTILDADNFILPGKPFDFFH